jgi:hypothetical protein
MIAADANFVGTRLACDISPVTLKQSGFRRSPGQVSAAVPPLTPP